MQAPKRVLRRIADVLRKQEAPGWEKSPFRRHLSTAQAKVLAERVSSAFETHITAAQVQDVAQVLSKTEDRMVGRIAGDVDDHVLSYFMIFCSSDLSAANTVAHSEIGVLFGGGLLMMLHALRSSGSDHWAVAIDPFEGYYGEKFDPVTRLPVTIDNVKANIGRLGFQTDRVRLVKARSESPEALQAAHAFSLASLWIDGDHSYQGIKRDWQNYSPLVIPGGYILLDNYNDGLFPGVDKFVDQDLLPNLAGWSVVANLSRSILFKKTSESQKTSNSAAGV